MAELNCSACDDIRQLDPNFVVNGFGDDECASLENDTGLSAASGHDDFTDLNLMNDCLVGVPSVEVDKYDVCDWKAYIKKLVPNLWTMIKGIICAIGGLWTNVHKLECEVNFLYQGNDFTIGEDPTDGSYIVAGKGISFLEAHDGQPDQDDIKLEYIAGGLMTGIGSLNWHRTNFTEPHGKTCYNFDNGSTIRQSNSRLGNSIFADTGRPASWGELLYEVRIKKSQYPHIDKLYAGMGMEQAGGAYRVRVIIFEEGQYAYGNHGHCNTETGEPAHEGNDSGHLVEEGYTYVQVRLSYADLAFTDGAQYTPFYMMGVRFKQGEVPC